MADTKQEYISIGRTRKAHGLSGELKVFIEPRYEEDFLKNERVFIDFKGARLPYFIAQVRGKGEMILQLEEVRDRNAAIMLQSKELFLRPQDLLKDEEREFEIEEEEALQYAYLQGFILEDRHAGEVGEIREVLEMPQQEMALVLFQGREILIPLNERFLLKIDKTAKHILTDLPEGLLDM